MIRGEGRKGERMRGECISKSLTTLLCLLVVPEPVDERIAVRAAGDRFLDAVLRAGSQEGVCCRHRRLPGRRRGRRSNH